jgi:hypothetical protein
MHRCQLDMDQQMAAISTGALPLNAYQHLNVKSGLLIHINT